MRAILARLPPLVLSGLPLVLALASACEQDYALEPRPVDVNPGEITECPFTRVEGTAFYRYDCNPVFSTTGEDWADTIRGTTFLVTSVLDHPFYQLWYTGVAQGGGEGFGLGYAVSPDGTAWTPQPANPLLNEPDDPNAWDADAMDGMQVVWDPSADQYLALYQGYNIGGDTAWGLGVAVSPDGQDWRRIESNPVMDLLTPVDRVEQWCWPLGLELGSVAGFTGYVAGATSTGHCEVYRINGENATNWSPDGDLVLPAGGRGAWDAEGFASLAVAELTGQRHMFYAGFGEWEDHAAEGYRSALHSYLGMATWQDGAWVKQLTPVPIHMTEGGDVSAVAAHTVGSRIHLWVTDSYDDVSAVGYFLYDPEAAAAEDGGAEDSGVTDGVTDGSGE